MKITTAKARYNYVCYNCKEVIQAGEVYSIVTLFPKEPPYLSEVPISARFCSKCQKI